MTLVMTDLPVPAPATFPRGPAPQRAGPPDGAPSPLERAEHFAAYLTRLSASEWDDVLQRVHAVDAAAHAAAIHRVVNVLDAHPNMDALNALQRAVSAAAPPNTSASRIATHAAFALALRDALSAHEFAALYGPFARSEPSTHAAGPHGARPPVAGDEPHAADRRVAVDALADVARPLGGE